MDELDKIIRKIQDLMKLAQDNPNDEEGQTALLMAQRLLLKYNLSMETVQDRSNKDKDVIKESMTEKDQDQTLRSIMRHTGQDMNMQLIQR